MRVLFSMRHTGALRNFASTLQALAERNHHVHLVFGQQDKEGDGRLLEKLKKSSTNKTSRREAFSKPRPSFSKSHRNSPNA